MNTLEFISSLIHSVIWPTVVFVLVLLFKEHLVQFIYSIRRVSFREVHVDVAERLTEMESSAGGQTRSLNAHEPAEGHVESMIRLTNQVDDIASFSPRAAILYTWSIVESSIYDIIKEQSSLNTGDITLYWKWLKKKKVLDRHTMKLLHNMHQLHEDVATKQGTHEVTPSDARRFCTLAQRIVRAIRERS
ncbi:hypothetical protein [Alkalicoccobacillus porphyridii]|uniref:DUF4145 domain-containing protein n=1 Tax=Alkalicoccobacillus porphyridii TaxID=2597270 RepID=A0A554A2N3_9BACI|nr:hypothetical protein [Alkalicoccobacillus porphyridii]TSB47906.1 hypothetical protein FN960_05210 [Alkalicoccobacillus porphyridii]